MKYKDSLSFGKGARHGLPIALGYFPVAFAFGMITADKGFAPWVAFFTSVTNFTGTGQFVGINLISLGVGLTELLFTLVIINARYVLMSVSLSQRLSPGITLWQRLLIAFGNTDEVFAVALNTGRILTFRYLCGLILVSYSGWVSGTAAGTFAGGALPASVASAFGIMLYAMFVAIIVPPAKENSPVLFVILIASAISCLFRYTPVLNQVSGGWVVIFGGILSAALGAWFFPQKPEEVDGDA